jgi:hypothetical protein
MLTVENPLPIQDPHVQTHPVSKSTCQHSAIAKKDPVEDKQSAEELKKLLLDMAAKPEYAPYQKTLRAAAGEVKIAAFGYNRGTTRKRILKLLAEYEQLEIDDLTSETRIAEKEIRAAIEELIAERKIIRGKRRRWSEPGKHYNDIYLLVPQAQGRVGTSTECSIARRAA